MSTPFSLSFQSTYLRSVDASDIITQLSLTSTDPVYLSHSGFRQVYGVVADGNGNLYVADYDAYVVYKVSSTGVVTRIAGTGTYGSSGYPGPALSCEFSGPWYLAVDAAGNVYVADNATYIISCINMQTTTQTILGVSIPAGHIGIVAGTLNVGGNSSGDGGAATSAVIEADAEICVAQSSGNLYLCDYFYGACVRKVTAATGIISNVAGSGDGTQGYSGDNGPAGASLLNNPNGVAVDANENVYIADTLNNRIRVVNTQATTQTLFGVSIPSGYINTIAGTGTAGDTGDGGLAVDAKLSSPLYVSLDSSSNLFISDSGNYKIRIVSPSTFDISTIAGTGVEGNTGNGGLATSAKLGSLGTAAAFYPLAIPTPSAQKVTISGGAFQTPAGVPLALGTVQVSLQQDVAIGGVQLAAGIKCTLQLDANGNVAGSPTLWGPVSYQMVPFSAQGERAIGYPALTVAIPNASTYSLTSI